jgi:hypothetical protein
MFYHEGYEPDNDQGDTSGGGSTWGDQGSYSASLPAPTSGSWDFSWLNQYLPPSQSQPQNTWDATDQSQSYGPPAPDYSGGGSSWDFSPTSYDTSGSWDTGGTWSASQPADYTEPDNSGFDPFGWIGQQLSNTGDYFSRQNSNYSPLGDMERMKANPYGYTATGQQQQFNQAMQAPGAVTDFAADSNNFLSGPASAIRNVWESTADPLMNFTPSIVGDASQGRFPSVLQGAWDSLTNGDQYGQELTARKQQAYNDAYWQAINEGQDDYSANQFAQQQTRRLNNANLAELPGLQSFQQLPQWAQAATNMADPVMWGGLSYAGRVARGPKVAPGEKPITLESNAPELPELVENPGPGGAANVPTNAPQFPTLDYYADRPGFVRNLQQAIFDNGGRPTALRDVEANRVKLLKNNGGDLDEYFSRLFDAAQKDGLSLDDIWKASGQTPPQTTAPAIRPAQAVPAVQPEAVKSGLRIPELPAEVAPPFRPPLTREPIPIRPPEPTPFRPRPGREVPPPQPRPAAELPAPEVPQVERWEGLPSMQDKHYGPKPTTYAQNVRDQLAIAGMGAAIAAPYLANVFLGQNQPFKNGQQSANNRPTPTNEQPTITQPANPRPAPQPATTQQSAPPSQPKPAFTEPEHVQALISQPGLKNQSDHIQLLPQMNASIIQLKQEGRSQEAKQIYQSPVYQQARQAQKELYADFTPYARKVLVNQDEQRQQKKVDRFFGGAFGPTQDIEAIRQRLRQPLPLPAGYVPTLPAPLITNRAYLHPLEQMPVIPRDQVLELVRRRLQAKRLP